MKRIAILTVIVLATIVFLPFVSASDWQTVTTFTGSADQTTQNFAVSATEWRLSWSYTPNPQNPQNAAFYILVYPQGETTSYNYIDSVYVTGSNQTSGIEYIHQGSQSYYLKISPLFVQDYTVTVEQAVQQDNSTTSNSGFLASISTTYFVVFVVGIILLVVVIWVLVARARRNRERETVKKQQYTNQQPERQHYTTLQADRQRALQAAKTPTQPPLTVPPPVHANVSQNNLGNDMTGRLEKLKELLDKNLITKEEYEKKKGEILSQL